MEKPYAESVFGHQNGQVSALDFWRAYHTQPSGDLINVNNSIYFGTIAPDNSIWGNVAKNWRFTDHISNRWAGGDLWIHVGIRAPLVANRGRWRRRLMRW